MGALSDLTAGVAAYLAANVEPTQNLDWQPTSAYTADKTGIYVATVPSTPNRIVTLTPYPMGDDPTLSESDVGLQVRSRSAAADPRDVFDLDDAIADVLLGVYPLTLATGVQISTLVRTSAVSLGQDDNQRWNWASSYSLHVHRPSLHRV